MNTQRFMLTHAARTGDCDEVLRIIRIDPTTLKFSALFEAIKHGHSACLDVLLAHMNDDDIHDVYQEGDLLLYTAVEFQHWDFFHKVFPMVNPNELEQSLFSSVVRSGNFECFVALEPYLHDNWDYGVGIAVQHKNVAALESLLPKYGLGFGRAFLEAIDRFEECPSMMDLLIPYATPDLLNQGLCHAVSRQSSVIPKILAVCDPKNHDNEALKNALAYGHFEIADMLVPVSDLQRVLAELLEDHYDDHIIAWLEERIAHDLNARLQHHIEQGGARESKIQRKM